MVIKRIHLHCTTNRDWVRETAAQPEQENVKQITEKLVGAVYAVSIDRG